MWSGRNGFRLEGLGSLGFSGFFEGFVTSRVLSTGVSEISVWGIPSFRTKRACRV